MNQDNKNDQEIDLSNELKNSDIKIEDSAAYSFYPEAPKMIQWMIKYSGGLIKNEKQASYILIGFIIIIVIIILFLFFSPSNQSPRENEYKPTTEYKGKNLPDDFR